MAIDKPGQVDAVGIEKNSDFAVLTILDAWDWQDEGKHLLALQSKLNAYFNFIESGQIWVSYPEAAGRQLVIDVVGRFPIPQVGIDLLHRASETCAILDLRIRYRHLAGKQ
jgi:hypothetical protein